ncbi:hypothetical protein EHP00_1938 [Ecytonucleospora hepatopenaei]|uniref:Uncharacterized protein n=1 Tax=Ecytonucleospora hepatopenaei TaxID=646526 RepID=A0A1W0E2Q7_9MICR|nr:hypothetical protein EHP00_1938 [Ecytonucleospora hepatopenaei]
MSWAFTYRFYGTSKCISARKLSLKRNMACKSCEEVMNTSPYSRNKDKFAFRCKTLWCMEYKKYVSIRKNSVLIVFALLSSFLKICWKWFITILESKLLLSVFYAIQQSSPLLVF